MKFLLSLFILYFNSIFSQTKERREDSAHIYWQPNTNLTEKDFQFDGTKEENAEKYCEMTKLCSCAATNINLIIDIPKSKNKREREKVYIVPVFDKIKSYNLVENDSIGIKQQKLVFDIEECMARYIRQEFKKTKTQFKDKYGLLITWHKVILNEAQKKKEKLIYEYTLDVYLEPKINAYKEWRIKVDLMLKDLKEFATTEEECERFISKKVTLENYEESVFLGCKNHN